MKRIVLVAILVATGGGVMAGCYATVRKPITEVWCYDPVWREGKRIGTQLAICETKDGESIQVIIAPIDRTPN